VEGGRSEAIVTDEPEDGSAKDQVFRFATEVPLLVRLLKFASLINRPMLDGVADVHQLSLNELRVMMSLGGEGEIAGHELARVMAMPPMNVSRALAALLDRGWVEPVRDEANRRRKPYRLSEAGWLAYRAMTPQVRGVADYLVDCLAPAERKTLEKLMEKLIVRVEAWPEKAAKE